MLCPECGIVVAPGPMRAREASDETDACLQSAASTDRRIRTPGWRQKLGKVRSILSLGHDVVRAKPSTLDTCCSASGGA